MSLNLVFSVANGVLIDFPFQTPTDLTIAVLSAEHQSDQLSLLDDAMKSWRWGKKKRRTHLISIKALMEAQALTLTMI